MIILERSKLYSVIGNCPHCGSKLLLEKDDIWWHHNIDGSKYPCVTCDVCDKVFDVEGWENIRKLY